MAPGSPAGSYALSGFDNINLYNGNLNFKLPLLQIGGRGTSGYTMTLATNTKQWQVNHEQPSATVNGYPGLKPAEGDGGGDEVATPNNTHTYTPQWKQWNTLNVGYGAGVMQGRQTGVETVTRQTCDTCPVVCQSLNPLWRYTLTRLTFITPDGTEHELRDAHTNGKPMLVEQARCSDPTGPGAFRGKTFVSSDGSAMTFISDTDIYDRVLVNRFTGNYLFSPTGVLYLRDGTRYHIALGRVDWIKDRNGNRIEDRHRPYQRFARSHRDRRTRRERCAVRFA